MRRHLLRSLERSAILQIDGNPGRPKAVALGRHIDFSHLHASLDHHQRLALRQRLVAERAALPITRRKEGAFWLQRQAGAVHLVEKILLERMVARHAVLLAASLVQSDPQPPLLPKNVVDPHSDRRPDAGEGVEEKRN